MNQAIDRDPARRFQRAAELAEAFAQASFGARSSHSTSKEQDPIDLEATQLERPSNAKGRTQSAGSWQFSPPILTSKLEAASSQNNEKAERPRTTKPVPSDNDFWQFHPPVVTGNLPEIETSRQTDGHIERVSPISLTDDSEYEAPEPMAKPSSRSSQSQLSLPEISSKEEAEVSWWSRPQEPMVVRNEAAAWNMPAEYGYDQPYSETASARRQRSERHGRNRRSGMRPGRRKVVAMLAAGGVAVIGGGLLVAANRNGIGMAYTALQPKNTQAADGNGTQANAVGQKMADGTVVGATTQAKNTAVAFKNPTNQKDSLLMHLSTETFTAFERACTHVGVV